MKQNYFIVPIEIVAEYNRFTNGLVTIEFRKNNAKQWVINTDSGIETVLDCSSFTIIELDITDFPKPTA